MTAERCPASGLEVGSPGWDVDCPVCGRSVAVRQDGTLGAHGLPSMRARERAARWLFARRREEGR